MNLIPKKENLQPCLEALLFYFYSFRVTQKHHFSIFTPSESLRNTTFLFLLLPSHSEASLFYFYSFRATQKHHFSIFTLSEPLRSTTFLFLLLPSHSDRATQKHHFSIFTPSEPLRSTTFLFLLLPSHSEARFSTYHFNSSATLAAISSPCKFLATIVPSLSTRIVCGMLLT